MAKLPYLIALLSAAIGASFGQATVTAKKLQDLNPGPAGSFPANIVTVGTNLYFSAHTEEVGTELFCYDGVRVRLAADVNDTTTDANGTPVGNGSDPNWLTAFNGALYFGAYEPRRGNELWRFDGTSATRVADLNADANDTIKVLPNSSWPSNLTVVNNILYFTANAGSARTNYELWKYTGTGAPVLAANIHPDSGLEQSSYPHELTSFNNMLIFAADDGVNGFELWKYDGTRAQMVTNINPGGSTSSSFPKGFVAVGGTLYFQAYHSSHGYELWRTDGTSAWQVSEINAGAESSYPDSLTALGDTLFFSATDGVHGFELWKATPGGAALVGDINPAGDSFPKELVAFGNLLCFAATDGRHGWELWKYDGTRAELVTDLNPAGDSFPEHLTMANGVLYFSATTSETGYELWRYDGTNVTLAADMNPGPGSSFPQVLTPYANQLFFRAAENESSDWEPWILSSATSSTPGTVQIVSVAKVGGDIRLRWRSSGSAPVVLQAADMIDGAFRTISASITPVNGAGEFADEGTVSSANARFYRVAQP